MIYMDIDYMEEYKDFTVNQERFPDFPRFVHGNDGIEKVQLGAYY